MIELLLCFVWLFSSELRRKLLLAQLCIAQLAQLVAQNKHGHVGWDRGASGVQSVVRVCLEVSPLRLETTKTQPTH